MAEEIFFICAAVFIIAIIAGVCWFAHKTDTNYEIGLDDERHIWNGRWIWNCTARDHFDRDGYVWHYNGNICARWSKFR